MRRAPLALATLAVTSAVPHPVVSWLDAGAHVGEVITVEGEVVAAHGSEDTWVLEFAPADPHAFRLVVLLPLFGSAARQPERLFGGQKVRATGRVQRFQGRPEMVLRSPDQIEVGEPAGGPAGAPPIAAPATETRPSSIDAAPCERARARWRQAATDAADRVAALGRCLDGVNYRCRSASAELMPALTALDAIERQVEAACR